MSRDPDKHQQRFDAVLADYLSQVDRGASPDREAFLGAHPDLAEELAGYFEVQDRMQRLAGPPLASNPTFGLGGGPGPATIAAAVQARTGGDGGLPSPTPDDPPLPTGSLLGQYRLQEVIGEGGMGRVYRARHHHLDRTVAIKVLAPRLCRDGSLVQRFHREARALARLQHANIVAVHDMGSQGDVHYFVMEHVDGPNLRQLMAEQGISPDRALTLVGQVCEALQFAHDEGIVHRDIKPENILLDRAGRPKVADFGLAKVVQDELGPGNLTRTDMVIGTYNYMAPEQKHSSRVDHRVDVYALGVVLYELLTGKLPAGHFALPSHVTQVPAGTDDLVLRALAAEPDERYDRARDLGEDCASALAGLGAPAAQGVRPTQQLPAELLVVDATDEKRLGGGPAGWLRVLGPKDDKLILRAWSRDEIAVASDAGSKKVKLKSVAAPSGPWAGALSLGKPGLSLNLPNDDCTLYLPEGLPVTISGAETEIEVNGLRAPLRIEPGEGEVHVRDHRGRLEIDRLDDGWVFVEGLVTSDLRIHTRKGDLTVAGLNMTSGQGVLHSDDGDLALGLDAGACSLTLEARSMSGKVVNDIEQLGEPRGAWLRAQLGGGAAALEASCYSGDVRLGHGAHLVRAELLRQALTSLAWTALWASLAYWWLGRGWVAFALIGWWGCDNLANVLRRFRRLDPDKSNFEAIKDWLRPRARGGSWHDRRGVWNGPRHHGPQAHGAAHGDAQARDAARAAGKAAAGLERDVTRVTRGLERDLERMGGGAFGVFGAVGTTGADSGKPRGRRLSHRLRALWNRVLHGRDERPS